MEEVCGAPPDRYPDALTAYEFAELVGLKLTAAKARIQDLLKAGKIERVSKRAPRASGGTLPIAAYRLLK